MRETRRDAETAYVPNSSSWSTETREIAVSSSLSSSTSSAGASTGSPKARSAVRRLCSWSAAFPRTRRGTLSDDEMDRSATSLSSIVARISTI